MATEGARRKRQSRPFASVSLCFFGILDRFWPMKRWECVECRMVWEQRREPGYRSYYLPGIHSGLRHDVQHTRIDNGWELGGYTDCGPIVYRARRVTT